MLTSRAGPFRTRGTVLTAPLVEGANPGIFVDCQHNLLASIMTRVTQRPKVDPPPWLPIEEYASLLIEDFRRGTGVDFVEPLDFEEWNSRWTPGKRAVMREARERPPRWLKMAFTKAEFVKPGDPRNIVCSDPTVLARLGPYTSAFDHALKRHPAAIKGYDMDGRAKKMAVLRQYSCFMTSDYSRFDKTVSSEVLKVENLVYLTLCPAMSAEPWIPEALHRAARSVHASSWRGIRYVVPAMRGTGDANTALGNWLLNRLAFLLVARRYPDFTVFIEGDDALCGHNYPEKEFEDEFRRVTQHLGYQTKCWSSPDLEVVPFCGRYLTASGPPRTVPIMLGYFFKWHVSKRTVYTQEEANALLRFKTMSYLAMEPSTPIIPAIAQYFLRVLPDTVFPTPEYVKVLKDNRGHLHRRRPTLAQRMIVLKQTGLTVDHQIQLERYFDSLQELQSEYLSILDFVPPQIGNIELCPLPPPKFENLRPRKLCRERTAPASAGNLASAIPTPTAQTPTRPRCPHP